MTDNIDLATITLDYGKHASPDEGMCLLEAVAYVSGSEFTDHPKCVSSVLGVFGRRLNDVLPCDVRQSLKPLITAMPGTAGDGQDEARGYMALDWLVRTYTPAWLDLAGLSAEAQALRDLRRIVDLVAAEHAGPVVRAGRDKAAAAGDAAGAAARATDRDAAWAAAGDAARDAAGAAAWAAARDADEHADEHAAGDAAWVAAWAAAWAADEHAAGAADEHAARDAARDALAPTVTMLQRSAIELLGRMINPAESDSTTTTKDGQ